MKRSELAGRVLLTAGLLTSIYAAWDSCSHFVQGVRIRNDSPEVVLREKYYGTALKMGGYVLAGGGVGLAGLLCLDVKEEKYLD